MEHAHFADPGVLTPMEANRMINDKTKQPVVLLCVAATIRVATVLHRNNVECSSPRNKEYNLHVPWVPHTEVPQTHVDYEYALQNG